MIIHNYHNNNNNDDDDDDLYLKNALRLSGLISYFTPMEREREKDCSTSDAIRSTSGGS